MIKIGFIVHGLTHFKALGSLIEVAAKKSFDVFILYYVGEYYKIYDKVTLNTFPKCFENIKKIPFNSYDQINNVVKINSLNWVVTSGFRICKSNVRGVKICSIVNFTDDIWEKSPIKLKDLKKLTLICYQGLYMLDLHQKNLGAKLKNAVVTGIPCLDSICKIDTKKAIRKYNLPDKYVLIMLPNIRREHYGICFGGENKFLKIIEQIYTITQINGLKLIAKSRKKQYFPLTCNKFFYNLFFDDSYHPSTSLMLMSASKNVILFDSSSIYESMMMNKFAINIFSNLNFSIGSSSKTFWPYFKANGPFDLPDFSVTLQQNKIHEIKKHFFFKCDQHKINKYKETYLIDNNNSNAILNKMLTL